MKYVQLKDGVAFAFVESPYFVQDSIALDLNLSWDDVKAKKYENGQWVEAPLIYFVTDIRENTVHGINSTVFSSDVTGDICSAETKFGWIKNLDGTFSEPPVVETPTLVEETPTQDPSDPDLA